MSQRCQRIVTTTVDQLCRLTQTVPAATLAALMPVVPDHAIIAQINAAALRGDVTTTTRACRIWWQTWQAALRHTQETQLYAPHSV